MLPERAVKALRDSSRDIDEELLPHLSSVGFDHRYFALISALETSGSRLPFTGSITPLKQ